MSEKYDESDSKSGESKAMDDAEFIKAVQDYFFGNEKLALTFEDFVNEQCHIVKLETDEYMVEYTEAHNQYKELFERKLTDYIVNLGYTVNDFYAALSGKIAEDPESSEAIFGMILQSVIEFDIFMVMMREARVRQEAMSSRK